MSRLALSLSSLLLAACAAAPTPTGDLLQGEGDARGVAGLERLAASGPFLAGATERFRAQLDPAVAGTFTWSATAGALTSSGAEASWTLPSVGSAELSLHVTHRDGTTGTMTWRFAITGGVGATASQALLAAPMPVIDGGTIEISGGSCDLQYEGTTSNIAMVFTSETHPSLTYGRWNGTSWTLEVIDGMGFNVGGVISRYVMLRVASDGTPHILYVRDDQPWYATRVSGNWVRERIDATNPAMRSLTNDSYPSLALDATNRPVVVYGTDLPYTSTVWGTRPVVAVRTAANTWTRTVITPAASTTSQYIPAGEVAVDGMGRVVFPVADTSLGRVLLCGVSGTSPSIFVLSATSYSALGGWANAALVTGSRLLLRAEQGVWDITLNSTLSASTVNTSRVEWTTTPATGDIGWAQTRPVVLHQHGSSLELVTTNAGGYWTYQQLGTSSGRSSALAVHPTTGVVSICYQDNNRILFQ